MYHINLKLSLAVLITSALLFYLFLFGQEEPPLLLRSLSASALTSTISTLFYSSSNPTTEAVLKGLLKREKSAAVNLNASIAIGFGACTDLVVDSLQIFEEFTAPANPQPHSQINTMQDLLELFAFYFKNAAAAERYIKSKAVFQQLLELVKKKPKSWREHIGGNAPLMSERFAKEGISRLLLGAQVTPAFARQLPPSVRISGPTIEQDDYHLLLEYRTGQRWGPYQTPRANRLIVHSDDNNAQLVSRAPFFEEVFKEFNSSSSSGGGHHHPPDLLIISGLQMLDNSPLAIQQRSAAIGRMADDLRVLQYHRPALKVHFEMASYTENALLGAVVDSLFPTVDSFGMNEQEVANLLSFLKYGNISLVSSPFPRIAHVLDEMRQLYSLLTMIDGGRVSRIHVHTLAYQVVAVKLEEKEGRDGKDAKDAKWPNSAAAMAKAALTAYRHTCGSEQVDLQTARILLDESFTTSIRNGDGRRIFFDPADPTPCWTEKLPNENPENEREGQLDRVQFCLAVGLVCTNVVQTGGGGDNVSAGGIVLQI